VIVAAPAAIPVTIPDNVPIAAVAGGVMLHVPPPPSVSGTEEPAHTTGGPPIAEGKGFTVTARTAGQPPPTE
jgi:hypothetical protein